MKNLLAVLSLSILTLAACSHGNCGAKKPEKTGAEAGVIVEKTSAADRVKVYKFDGSLQCGQGKKISLADMQKDLGTIKVYSSVNKNDGMMRIQLCGSPTGNANVYEIDRTNLEAALKAGFKEWVQD